MSKQEKLLQKLQTEPTPKDITWAELTSALRHLGYDVRTGTGSRRKFIHKTSLHVMNLHEPHPQPQVKPCYIKQVIESLKEIGHLNNNGE